MYRYMYISAMTKRYSIAEARASLPSIVDEVEAGNEIELTRRGKSVAVVLSRQLYDRMRAPRPAFADGYTAFRERFDLKEIGDEGDVFEGLRDPAPGRAVDL